MKQTDIVIAHFLKYGELTPLEALQKYGIFRLAAVVHKLRKQGWAIDAETRSTMVAKNGVKRFAAYQLTNPIIPATCAGNASNVQTKEFKREDTKSSNPE